MNNNSIINKVANFFKSSIVYYVLFAFILLCYDINLTLNIILYTAFILLFVCNIKEPRFLYSLIPLMFFEAHIHSTLIVSPFMLSSLMKVYYILFAIRVIIDFTRIIKNRNTESVSNELKMDILSLAMAVVFVFSAILYEPNISSGVLYQIKNSALVLYLVFMLNANKKNNDALGEFLKIIALSAFLCGIYAFIYNVYWDNRFCSTIADPNYSSLIYGVGIFASIGLTKLNKYIKTTLTVCLAVFLGLTMSFTGFFVTGALVIVYLLIYFGFKRVMLLLLVLVVLCSTILLLPSQKNTKLYRLQTRINKFYVIDETDFTFEGHDDYSRVQLYLNYVTNNRYYLNQQYSQEFLNLSTKEKLFGGNNTVDGEFQQQFVEKVGYVSHNSFMDMLYMIGLIPLTALLAFVLLKLINMIKEYINTKSKPILCMIFIKVLVIGIGLTISMFPYRYFITFMIL